MNELFNSAKRTITLKDHVSTQGLNVISRMLLGKKYMEKSEDSNMVSPEEFREMMDELFFLNEVLNIWDYIPWIDFLDLQGYVKRMKVVSNKLDRLLEHVLDEHIERRKGMKHYAAKDMMDVLLQLSEDPTLEVKLGRTGVKAITQDLMTAGADTSSVAIEWAMRELLKKPEVLKKATKELGRVIGRERWVEEKDIVNVSYIDAIVKKAMRLHPVSPLLVPRVAREDFNVDGYDIPKGTQLLVNIWAIGRDPAIWDNPDESQPERFLGKDIDMTAHDYEFLPFGAGRRMCPGYPLGLKVILGTFANLLHGFNWRLPGNMKKEELRMEEIFKLTVPKKLPLEVVVEPRFPNHLYSL